MQRKIHLHGSIGAKYGETFELDVSTAAEAVRALRANFPMILEDFRDSAWRIVRGDADAGMELGENEITEFQLGRADLHFIPVVAGSKNDGTLKVVLGAVLLGASFAVGGPLAAPVAGSGLIGGMFSGGNLAMLGASMILGGVSQLLAPEEKETKEKNSFTMNGPGNSNSQGAPVPVVYGEVITGGVLVSGGLDIEDIGNTLDDNDGKSSGKGKK